MIATVRHPASHSVALELLLRATAVVVAVLAILGLLPAIAGAAA